MQAVLILVYLPLSSAVTHSLHYFYTATSGISSFPEFVAVGMVDGLVISQYDSDYRDVVLRQAWMEEHLDQQYYWESETRLARRAEGALKADIQTLKERFNQTEGEHVLQRRYGCEWDDESDDTSGYEEYGYDGEDFISLDLTNMRWEPLRREAAVTSLKWNRLKSILNARKQYFNHVCRDNLKKYVQYGNRSQWKVAPELSLIQKKSSSTVTCHATGFYPDGVIITWKRDGEEMQEDVEMGETLPNGDGTFQKRAELRVSPEERERSQYTCEVTHQGGQTLIILTEDDGNTQAVWIFNASSSTIVFMIAALAILVTAIVLKKTLELAIIIEIVIAMVMVKTTAGNTLEAIVIGCLSTTVLILVIALVERENKNYRSAKSSDPDSDASFGTK